jgi:hypothetical protein
MVFAYGVDKIESPGVSGEVLEGNWVGVDVEGKSGLDTDVENHETLGSQLVWEDFNGVADKETRPGKRVKDTEQPDEEHHGNVGSWGVELVIESRGQSPEDEGTEHTTSGNEEERSSTNLVNEKSHGDTDDEGEESLANREL